MIVLVLLGVALIAGLGLAESSLFWVAAGLFLLWLIGWFVRVRGGRWYFW